MSVIPSSDEGESLAKLKLSLESALNVELSSGTFSVNLDGDWLTIEMTGPLLFAAGSHTLLNGAKKNIEYIAEVLKPVNNMIRLRGYTDTNLFLMKYINQIGNYLLYERLAYYML